MARFETISQFYAARYPGLRQLLVTPRIGDAADRNPYLRLLYRNLDPSLRVRSIGGWRQLLAPLLQWVNPGATLWHQHWLQFSGVGTFIRTNVRLLSTALFQLAGGQVVWTLHNETPHVAKYRRLNDWYRRQLAARVQTIHVHNAAGARVAEAVFGASPAKVVIVPHPAYPARRVSREEALRVMREYGLDLPGKQVLLMFGMVARYKGVLEVVRWCNAQQDPGFHLVIAGSVRGNESDYGRQIESEIKADRCSFLKTHVPEEHVPHFMQIADLVVFNYQQILTSGAIVLCRSYGKKMLLPDLSNLRDEAGPDATLFASLDDWVAHVPGTRPVTPVAPSAG